MKKANTKKNYFDFVPKIANGLKWNTQEDGLVVIEKEHIGLFAYIAQRLFRKPRTTSIHLEKYGSYLWNYIDGNRTVLELAMLQKKHFGEEVEPVYSRIVMYFRMMENCGFIEFVEKQ